MEAAAEFILTKPRAKIQSSMGDTSSLKKTGYYEKVLLCKKKKKPNKCQRAESTEKTNSYQKEQK